MFDMVLKVSETKFYHIVETRSYKTLVSKKILQLLKIFILSEKCLSVAWMHFSKVKMLKIWNFWICVGYGLKSFPNEILSNSGRKEATDI